MDEYKWLAKVYDPVLYIVMHRVRKKVADIVSRLHPGRIIDICCGTGNQLKYLKKQGFEDIVGVDLSQAMINQAGKGSGQIPCENQDASSLSFKDNSFDLGIISYALHEKSYETARKMIHEAERVIQSRGSLILVDYLFKDTVRFPARAAIHTAERIAGKDHYRYFRKYLTYGGMDKLMEGYHLKEEYRFHANATGIRVYSMDKYGQYA